MRYRSAVLLTVRGEGGGCWNSSGGGAYFLDRRPAERNLSTEISASTDITSFHGFLISSHLSAMIDHVVTCEPVSEILQIHSCAL